MTRDREEGGLARPRGGESLAREREGDALVPVSYAEKTMNTMLRLHDDLVEEKERRIDLYRRLMDREQELAELRAYVGLLEGELGRRDREEEQRPSAPANEAREPTQPPAAEAPRAPEPPPASRPQPTAAPGGEEEALEERGPVIAWLPSNLNRL